MQRNNSGKADEILPLYEMTTTRNKGIINMPIINNERKNFNIAVPKKQTHSNRTNVVQTSNIYIVNAYHLSNNSLRVLLIAHCGFKNSIIEVQYTANAQLHTIKSNPAVLIYETCPNFYYMACIFGAFYAEFQLPSEHSIVNEIMLRRSSRNFGGVKVPVTQVTSARRRKHFLAVCIKPLYYFHGWVQLIQFLESWLINGATKFYIYWRSMSFEVERIIKLYQTDGVDIETIQWPSARDDETRLFLSGQLESLHDCILRTRSDATFVALFDLDELVFMPDEPLINFLQRLGIEESGISLASQEVTAYKHTKSGGNSVFA